MSAIAGIWSFDGGVPVATACKDMAAALSVYGGDDQAQYAGPSFAMARCLLRLLPEDTYDRQPLAAQGVTALVADVRIDNREAIASTLGLASAQLKHMADSEVLLAAWLRWGEACVDHLCGAFAFAVWNEQEQQLFLARDHSGERPLFYASSEHGFAFASMPKGLHALPFLPAEIDED